MSKELAWDFAPALDDPITFEVFRYVATSVVVPRASASFRAKYLFFHLVNGLQVGKHPPYPWMRDTPDDTIMVICRHQKSRLYVLMLQFADSFLSLTYADSQYI